MRSMMLTSVGKTRDAIEAVRVSVGEVGRANDRRAVAAQVEIADAAQQAAGERLTETLRRLPLRYRLICQVQQPTTSRAE